MTTSEFGQDVSQGLGAPEKFLSSRYFYDQRGDSLFRAIMATPEYYLTDAEHEILSTQGGAIVEQFLPGAEIIELGAGDGTKSKVLLAEHLQRGKFCYSPIDISGNSLDRLSGRMKKWLPGLEIRPITGEYMEALNQLPRARQQRVCMFMGANIGNFTPPRAEEFLAAIRGYMSVEDRLLIGFDLKKDPNTILAAYNDASGHTRAFNLNLLERINRELGGDFDLEQFEHYPCYDPQSGACKSYLVSGRAQSVFIKQLDERFEFIAGECILMEIAQKYSPAGLQELARQSGFCVQAGFTDTHGYFIDQFWQPQP